MSLQDSQIKRNTYNFEGDLNYYQNTNSKNLSSSKGGDCEEYIVYLVQFDEDKINKE